MSKKDPKLKTTEKPQAPFVETYFRPGQGLAAKMVAVMSDVNKIEKTGYNSFHGYQYATKDDVIEAARKIMVQHGIALSCHNVSSRFEDDLCVLDMQITLTEMESGDSRTHHWQSTAKDKSKTGKIGDKAIYKAISSGLKYFLMVNFLISSGDPTDDCEYEPAQARNYSSTPSKEKSQKPKKKSVAKTEMSPRQRKFFDLFTTLKNVFGIVGDMNNETVKKNVSEHVKQWLRDMEILDKDQVSMSQMTDKQLCDALHCADQELDNMIQARSSEMGQVPF